MILLNLIIKPVWIFGIDRQVQIHVGAAVYGKYFALMSLVYIFNILLDIGISNYANRHIAADITTVPAIFGNGIAAKALLSFIYTIVIVIIAKGSGINDNRLLLSLIMIQILSSLLLFGRGIVSALQLFKTDAFLSVTDRTLLIFMAGLWLYTSLFKKVFTIYDFAWLQVVTIASTLVICFFVLLKKKVFSRIVLDKAGIYEIVKQSLPFALTVFFMGLHNRTDAFLLERLHKNGPSEAGIYAAAYRLLDAANMIGYLFAAMLVSYWSKHVTEKQVLKKSLLFSHQLLIPSGILLATVSIFLNQRIYLLLYHHTNEYGGEILRLCLIAIVPYFITHIYGTMLTATGNIKTYMWIVLFSAIINITTNSLLIPVWGAKACVTISLCSQSLLAVLTILFVKKQTGLSVGAILWFKYFVVAAAIAVSLMLLGNTRIGIWATLISITCIWIVMMNLLQIFSIRSFLKLMNEK